MAAILDKEEEGEEERKSEKSQEQQLQQQEDPMASFTYALRAPETKRQWPRRLKVVFDYMGLSSSSIEDQAKEFVDRTTNNPKWAQGNLIRFLNFQRQRVMNKEISEATIPNYYKAVKLFCEMNDLSSYVNWKKISCGLPRARQSANDRAPTVDELQRLVEFPDRRIKPIVYTMISSGFRIGAWELPKMETY